MSLRGEPPREKPHRETRQGNHTEKPHRETTQRNHTEKPHRKTTDANIKMIVQRILICS